MSYSIVRSADMALGGTDRTWAMEKKRWMLRNFGGSTEIMVYADEKTVYWGAADELQGMTRG